MNRKLIDFVHVMVNLGLFNHDKGFDLYQDLRKYWLEEIDEQLTIKGEHEISY